MEEHLRRRCNPSDPSASAKRKKTAMGGGYREAGLFLRAPFEVGGFDC